MKKLLLATIFLTFFHCYGDNWIQRASVGGIQRTDAVGFSIDSIAKGYVGTGADGIGGSFFNDFWEYNPSTDTWTQKANYPGVGRVGLIGFSIGSKGYVGGGITGASVGNDFWEFDPVINIWTAKANLPNGGRSNPFTFSIGRMGYVGAGWDTAFAPTSDFWEYDPMTNAWSQKANFGGGANAQGIGMATSNKGYACMGFPGFNSDFWEYNPSTNLWTQKANVGGPMHADAVGFSICEKVYLGTDETTNAGNFTNQLWEYDPTNNQWIQKANFIGSARDEAVAFSLLGKGYLGTGYFGLTDWYEYTPDSCIITGVSQLINRQDQIRIYPNPFKDELNINLRISQLSEIIIYDITFRKILQQSFVNSTTINSEQLPEGIYIYEVRNKNGVIQSGKVVKE